MLIFHTADIHLNSNLKSNLDGEKAKLRRDEIKNNFYNLISLAEKQNVQFFIIAGDMFDTETGIVRLKNQFLDIVSEHPNIKFLYVNGNHDETSFLNEDIPPNLYVFKKDWTYYDFDNITFAGKFVPIAVKADHFDGLNLNPNRTNIVVLHGDITLTNSEDIDYAINLNALKGKNIDYLALGHKHDFEQGRLDNRGTFAYPGTLDGRGFDEIGTKGYISIDDSMLPTFHAYSSRVYEEEYIDIIRKKTAILFIASAQAAAISANANNTQYEALTRFAEFLGICFQIKDDILDYSPKANIGKPTLNDIREGKITLPLQHALKISSKHHADLILNAVKEGNFSEEFFYNIGLLVARNGGIEYAEKRMYYYKEEAIKALQCFPESETKVALINLLSLVLERDY